MDIQPRLQRLGIDDEDSPQHCERLAIQAYEEYVNSGSKAALDNAVKFGKKSIRVAHDGDNPPHHRLNNLSAMLLCRYERTGDVTDLEDAINIAGQAIDSRPHATSSLSNLSRMFECRYWRFGDKADLEEAVRLARQAVNLTPPEHPSKATYLSNLGNKLHNHYKMTNEIVDLEEAITVTTEAINSTPNGGGIWATWLYNLSMQLTSRYDRTTDVADLEEAVLAARQSVNSAPHNFYMRATMLDSLGAVLCMRHERTGDMTDIDQAIIVTRQAVNSTPPDHADRWLYLKNLGDRLRHRYVWTGELADIEVAITVTRQAVSLWPSNHANNSTPLINLGILLACRYERSGLLVDIDEAIMVIRKAIDSTPLTRSARASALASLGKALGRRYERTMEMADIEEALKAIRQAINPTLQDHDGHCSTLTDLGNALWRRYKQTGDIANLEEAITVTRQAVDSTPHDNYRRAVRLNSLGFMLEDKHRRTAKMADLEEAIMVARQGINATQRDDPHRAVYLYNLGNQLCCRFQETVDGAYLEEALSCFLDAWDCKTATPFNRVKAASRCLPLLALQGKLVMAGNLNVARQLGKDIINLLPTLNTRLLDRADQQFVVSNFAGVAANTCALLLEVNQPADALYYLEKGRAVIIGHLVDVQSDLSTLVNQYPDLARRYELLRDEVNTPTRGFDQDKAGVWAHRRKAMEHVDACVMEIRDIPGQERFLLGQTTAEMQECAAGGTIVVVNIASFRSDAILVSTDGIQTLSLPKLSASDAAAWLSRKWTGRRAERPQKNKEYLEYLSWLWEACVKQTLDKVYKSHDTASGLPRVWWIGTGLASSMPFHAAGIHSGGSTENALSRAISSYVPSIKALGYSRHRARVTDPAGGTLLITTMPTTPGNGHGLDQNSRRPPELPGVVEEKRRVVGAAGGHLKIESLDLPSVGQVVDRLENCCIAHFACHGYTDHSDPSNSGLILQNCVGGQDEQDTLTVRRVSELKLKKARVAYLSACSTAENKAAQLSDEVIHVVSGFQMAGFPHVVGCLWPSIDSVCVEVASGFYSVMLGKELGGWVGRGVASALREAVLEVRAREMGSPLTWAPFVHYGA